MPKYNVYLFPIVCVKVAGVEADDHAAAIHKVLTEADLGSTINDDTVQGAEFVQYADEIVEYLVDEAGDTGYHGSRRYIDLDFLDGLRCDGLPHGAFRYQESGEPQPSALDIKMLGEGITERYAAIAPSSPPAPSFPAEESRGTIAGLPIEPAYSEANARDDDLRELVECLDSVSAALDSVMAHYGHGMPQGDVDGRSQRIREAHALIEKYRKQGL